MSGQCHELGTGYHEGATCRTRGIQPPWRCPPCQSPTGAVCGSVGATGALGLARPRCPLPTVEAQYHGRYRALVAGSWVAVRAPVGVIAHGCGSFDVTAPDDEGLRDCRDCGLWFSDVAYGYRGREEAKHA